MTFDVASVREIKKMDMRAGPMIGRFVPNTATYRATNLPIEYLFSFAYGVDQYQIVGVPKWPFPTLFAIEAKGGSEADAKMAALAWPQRQAEQQHMLQALMEDRFKLKVHWETKEGNVYNLAVAKGGPKLGVAGSVPPSADEVRMFGNHPVPPLYQKNKDLGIDLIAQGCSMDLWVGMLAGFRRPVIDNTGLTAKYDFVLKCNGQRDLDPETDDQDPLLPLDRALREELGLKVESAKGLVRVLVIDHIDKPSEN